MSLTRIIAAVIDKTVVTIYKPDGRAIELLQGDPRIQTVIDAMPAIEQQGFADIDLNYANPYGDFQNQFGGIVQFFRVAKKAVAEVMDALAKMEVDATAPLPVGSVGTVPSPSAPVPVPASDMPATPAVEPTPVQATEPTPVPSFSQQAAVQEIMKHAESATAEGFSSETLGATDTIVAVTGSGIVPGVEQVASHLAHSVKIGSSIGMQKFLERAAAIAPKRQHSVEDLLRFMEKNDLPIADDGSLIVYKVLRRGAGGKGYVDCHTRKVQQRIGSFVCVDESLVDKNRRNECSNGLHVARRGYIAGFGGDVCTIVKVAPEDVITVPHGDPNKVRVSGYHVLMELEPEAWDKLKQNVPMTDNPKAAKMLGRAVSGDHVAVLERVEIKGQQGTNVVITQLEGVKAPVEKSPVAPAVALDDETVKTETEKAEPVSQEKLDEVIKTKANEATQQVNGRQAKAAELLQAFRDGADIAARKAAAQELLTFKRTAKVSWDKLNISQEIVDTLVEAATMDVPAPTPEPQAPVAEQPAQAAPQGQPEGRREKAQRLLTAVKNTNDDPLGRSNAAKELLAFKKASKIGWDRLGLTQADVNIVTKAAG